MARAKAHGVYKGTAHKLSAAQLELAKEKIAQGVPKAKVARDLGVGRSTLYRYLKISLNVRDREPTGQQGDMR
ncbi:helix-turn-helix domain-containing protein [Corynebacterium mastitidis]|uniref:helix-turn-helix domain-containing protein n=1 Tax=Corynebacterium mastitidis TaxID=161890 RepID=UPI0030EA3957